MKARDQQVFVPTQRRSRSLPTNPVGKLITHIQAALTRKRGNNSPRPDILDDLTSPNSEHDHKLADATADPVQQPAPTVDVPATSQQPHAAARDALTLAICDIATFFGQAAAPATLKAGLSLQAGLLPLEHVELAAERAGLTSRIQDKNPASLGASDLPVIVIDKERQVSVLWEITAPSDATQEPTARFATPGNPAQNWVEPLADVKTWAKTKLVTLQPAGNVDTRANEALNEGNQNWFLPAFKHSRKIYAEAILATIAVNVLGLAVPLFSMNVYDRVLPNAAETTLWALALGVGIAITFEFVLRTLRAVYVDAASRRADVRLSGLIFGRLMGARLHTKPPSIGVRANTMREFETLREFINSATLTAFGDLPFLILFIGVMWIVAGPLALIVLAAIPVILTIGWLTQRSLDHLISRAFQNAAQKNAVIVETLTGLETIKATGAENWAANKWERATAENIRVGLDIRHTTNLGQHAIHTVQTMVQVLIVVAGFYIVAQGQMTMGALIAATILSGRALQPLAQAANLLARLNQARIAYTTLSEIVNAPQERPSNGTFVSKTECDGKITFENVSFAYDPEAPLALHDFSAKISQGEHVGIIGSIGSGKSTALKLLQALHAPSNGRVLIDDTAVSQIEPVLLRTHVGLLLQGCELFHGTIRENITLGDLAATDETVIKAAHTAGAIDWIAKLPHGFDTPLSERGADLSGGQRQSLALARTLLKNPAILALDEPTSDMDPTTERRVIERLKKWSNKRTLLIVTHRPAVLDLVDRLIVIEDGVKRHDGSKPAVLNALKAQNTRQKRKVRVVPRAPGGASSSPQQKTAPAKGGEK